MKLASAKNASLSHRVLNGVPRQLVRAVVARDLLRRHADLAGFYVGGGGVDGVVRAARLGRRVVGVGHDLTASTRESLRSGLLHAVLSHPLPALATLLVAQMAEAREAGSAGLRHVVVPLEIHTPESV
jgi:LacI family transcriptional regulator